MACLSSKEICRLCDSLMPGQQWFFLQSKLHCEKTFLLPAGSEAMNNAKGIMEVRCWLFYGMPTHILEQPDQPETKSVVTALPTSHSPLSTKAEQCRK